MTLQFDPSDVSGVTVFSNKNDTAIPLRITNNKVVLIPDDIVGVGSLKVVFKSNKFGEVEYIDNFIAEGRKLNVSLHEGKIIIAVQDSGYY